MGRSSRRRPGTRAAIRRTERAEVLAPTGAGRGPEGPPYVLPARVKLRTGSREAAGSAGRVQLTLIYYGRWYTSFVQPDCGPGFCMEALWPSISPQDRISITSRTRDRKSVV